MRASASAGDAYRLFNEAMHARFKGARASAHARGLGSQWPPHPRHPAKLRPRNAEGVVPNLFFCAMSDCAHADFVRVVKPHSSHRSDKDCRHRRWIRPKMASSDNSYAQWGRHGQRRYPVRFPRAVMLARHNFHIESRFRRCGILVSPCPPQQPTSQTATATKAFAVNCWANSGPWASPTRRCSMPWTGCRATISWTMPSSILPTTTKPFASALARPSATHIRSPARQNCSACPKEPTCSKSARAAATNVPY